MTDMNVYDGSGAKSPQAPFGKDTLPHTSRAYAAISIHRRARQGTGCATEVVSSAPRESVCPKESNGRDRASKLGKMRKSVPAQGNSAFHRRHFRGVSACARHFDWTRAKTQRRNGSALVRLRPAGRRALAGARTGGAAPGQARSETRAPPLFHARLASAGQTLASHWIARHSRRGFRPMTIFVQSQDCKARQANLIRCWYVSGVQRSARGVIRVCRDISQACVGQGRSFSATAIPCNRGGARQAGQARRRAPARPRDCRARSASEYAPHHTVPSRRRRPGARALSRVTYACGATAIRASSRTCAIFSQRAASLAAAAARGRALSPAGRAALSAMRKPGAHCARAARTDRASRVKLRDDRWARPRRSRPRLSRSRRAAPPATRRARRRDSPPREGCVGRTRDARDAPRSRMERVSGAARGG